MIRFILATFICSFVITPIFGQFLGFRPPFGLNPVTERPANPLSDYFLSYLTSQNVNRPPPSSQSSPILEFFRPQLQQLQNNSNSNNFLSDFFRPQIQQPQQQQNSNSSRPIQLIFSSLFSGLTPQRPPKPLPPPQPQPSPIIGSSSDKTIYSILPFNLTDDDTQGIIVETPSFQIKPEFDHQNLQTSKDESGFFIHPTNPSVGLGNEMNQDEKPISEFPGASSRFSKNITLFNFRPFFQQG